MNAEIWEAIIHCDPAYDGKFYYGVHTTGIFCRPSCKSKKPKRENVSTFKTIDEALSAGFRPCKRCRPEEMRRQAVPTPRKKGEMMQNAEKVYWSSLNHKGWILYAAVTSNGLCCVTLPNESFEDLTGFVQKHIPDAMLERNEAALAPYLRELKEYLEGKRQQFSVPLDLRGTPFQVAVWKSLLQIPYGQWTTYSDIAASIGRPSAVRAVGAAIGANPIPFVIPCHRVIGKNGKLTGYSGGLELKSALLKLENVRLPQTG